VLHDVWCPDNPKWRLSEHDLLAVWLALEVGQWVKLTGAQLARPMFAHRRRPSPVGSPSPMGTQSASHDHHSAQCQILQGCSSEGLFVRLWPDTTEAEFVIRVFWETALYVIGGLGARMVLTFLWSLSLPTFGSFFVFSGAAAVVAVTFIQMALQTGPMRFMLYFVGLCSAVYLVVSWVLIPALVLVSFAHECFIFPLEYALDAVGRIPHTLGVSIISHCGAIFAGYPAATLSKLLLWPLPTASIRAVTPPLAPSAPGFFTGIFAALISAIVNWIFSCVVSIFWMFVSFAPFFAVIAFTAFILGKIVTWETQHLTKHAPRHQACRQAPRHQACRQAPSRQPQSNANQNNHQNGRRNVTGSVRWPKVANNKAANNKKPKNRQNKRC